MLGSDVDPAGSSPTRSPSPSPHRSRPRSQSISRFRFTYVYTLESLSHPERIYTGQTGNIRRRLGQHNGGEVISTSRHRPWRIRTVTAFRDRARALAFERYLKSGSGRAFLRRHL